MRYALKTSPQEECEKFGSVKSVHIPRPSTTSEQEKPGVGFVFVAFDGVDSSAKAAASLRARTFDGRKVRACVRPSCVLVGVCSRFGCMSLLLSLLIFYFLLPCCCCCRSCCCRCFLCVSPRFVLRMKYVILCELPFLCFIADSCLVFPPSAPPTVCCLDSVCFFAAGASGLGFGWAFVGFLQCPETNPGGGDVLGRGKIQPADLHGRRKRRDGAGSSGGERRVIYSAFFRSSCKRGG